MYGGPEFPVALVLAEDWVRDCWIAEAVALDSVPIFTVTVSLVGLESAITGHALHAANRAGRTNDCEMCARANRRIVINPRRACARGLQYLVCLSVCLSVSGPEQAS